MSSHLRTPILICLPDIGSEVLAELDIEYSINFGKAPSGYGADFDPGSGDEIAKLDAVLLVNGVKRELPSWLENALFQDETLNTVMVELARDDRQSAIEDAAEHRRALRLEAAA